MRYFIGLFVLMVSGLASAQTITYVDRPAWADPELPDQTECTFKKLAGISIFKHDAFNCQVINAKMGPLGTPHKTQALVDDGFQKKVIKEKTNLSVVCSAGICRDKDTQAFAGRLTSPLDKKTYNVTLTRGHYVHNVGKTMYAQAYGTGPQAQDFPEYIYLSEDSGSLDLGPSNTVADIGKDRDIHRMWCNPRGDTCAITFSDGDKIDVGRPELTDYVRFADASGLPSWQCSETCRDDNNRIIGLNPDYHAF